MIWQELKRRKVMRVAIAYLLMAWVVLQIADIVLPAMGLPEWSITATLILLAVGFPLALVLSWVFDITPDGIERTEALTESAPHTDLSIAVLPFEDLSEEKNQSHFCDGLTEELLSMLARVPNLRVASRLSCFAFKGRQVDLAEITERLRVAHVLEGSVRKDGDRVRITAQLTRIASNSVLWAETFDRELCDIFAIQEDLSNRILMALKLELGTEERADPTTSNPKAYEYFLRGRGHALTNAKHDLERARDLFQKAVELDPEFTRAWIHLAEVASTQAIFLGGGQDSRELADRASAQAMKLAPGRANSQMARGFAQLACHCYEDAELAFLKAVEIDPGLVRAWHYLARTAHHMGQKDKELAHFRRATRMDHEDWESPVLALATFVKMGDMEGAEQTARVAVDRVERHLEDYPDNPRAYYLGLGALTTLGEHEKARQWAEHAHRLAPNDPPTRYNLACYYARNGETDQALDLLENSISSRSWIENDNDLDSVRDHPRYRQILDAIPD